MVFGGGTLGVNSVQMWSQGWRPHEEISIFIREETTVHALFLPTYQPPWKHTARWQSSANQELGSYQGPNLQHFILDFPASRPVGKCLVV